MGFFDSPANVWPDTEKVTIAQLRNFLSPRYPSTLVGGVLVPGINIGTAIPVDVQTLLPYVRVIRAPGGGRASSQIERISNLDVEFLAADWPTMTRLSDLGNAAVLGLKGTHFVDWVEVADPPHYLTFNNPAIFRSIATYQLTTRATSVA